MPGTIEFRVYENQQLIYSGAAAGPLELGRQRDEAEPLFAPRGAAGLSRLAIARLEETSVSRKHLRLEPLADGRARITNVSAQQSVRIDGVLLPCGQQREVPLPVVLTLGSKTVRVQAPEPDDLLLQSLAEPTIVPGTAPLAALRPSLAGPPNQPEALVAWFQTAVGILQSAATSSDFFARAARALVDLVGLDSGQVLLWKDSDWQTQTVQSRRSVDPSAGAPSRSILGKVRDEKRTFWQVPAAAEHFASLRDVEAVVAAPILDRRGQVIGALYGDRRQAGGTARPITRLDALLVELFAGGVAAGLARLEQEQAALAARVQFEQFFTPELARQLAAQPDLLQGKDAEVTLLFCDIRGFSRVSERLGPARTVEWIGDVMGALSDCVSAEAGVLVDYIGDELLAMWGAPEAQPDHARLACSAALAMLDQLPKLNERWQSILEEPMGLGIGINTGVARVGNTGSHRKFKYGPLGNTVNLASRVQGATKYLKTRCVVTRATREQLGAEFAVRRLCRVRVVNIAEPVDLFELGVPGQPAWAALQKEYDKALTEFDGQDFRAAARTLGNLLADHPDDGPALVLLGRAVNALVDGLPAAHPVWELPGK